MGEAADRTLMVLDTVASSEKPLGLMELAGLTGLDKSVLSRLLQSLVRSGFVMRDARTRDYGLGPRFVSLSVSAVRRSGFAGMARELLSELRDRTGETVSVHLWVGESRVCIDGAESPHAVRRALSVGESVPVYSGPSGKAIMAFLPEAALSRVMKAAEAANQDMGRIRGLLATLRQKSYLVVTGDRTPGVGAVSTPLFDESGVVASLTIAGPEDRWSVSRMEEFAPRLVRTGVDISQALRGTHPSTLHDEVVPSREAVAS